MLEGFFVEFGFELLGLVALELDIPGPGCASLLFSAQPPGYELCR